MIVCPQSLMIRGCSHPGIGRGGSWIADRGTTPQVIEGLFSNVDAEHEPPTDTNMGLAVTGLNTPLQAVEVNDQKGSAMTAFNLDQYALFIGLDVGKSEHPATALTSDGTRVYDKALPNSQPKLAQLLTKLVAQHGPTLLVVDQPATIAALPVAVAQSLDDWKVAYLPVLSVRRVVDLHPGSPKPVSRDAYLIAETASTMPATLRALVPSDEQFPELAVLAGFDDDL